MEGADVEILVEAVFKVVKFDSFRFLILLSKCYEN